MIPSVKGIAIQSTIEDLRKLVEGGGLSREALEAELPAEDLRALDEEVAVARWYPIATHQRMLELLARHEGAGRRTEYLLARGARAADRIAALGLYRQLDLSTEQFGARVGSMIVTVSGAIYNFTRWVYVPEDPGAAISFRIQVDEAADFPETAVLTSQGFIEQIASKASGAPVRVTHERPRPDRVLFRGRGR